MLKYRLSIRPVCSLILLAAAWPLLNGILRAQETNAPKTKLEAFEAQTGVIIVEGSMIMGSVFAQNGLVSVRCKESKTADAGRRESGLAIEVREGEARTDTTIIDYDELDSFLNALDYVSKADSRVTTLPLFDVFYATRGGLSIATYSSNRSPGTIHVALQSNHFAKTRVMLIPQQLAEFQGLMRQAKAKLDSLRTVK